MRPPVTFDWKLLSALIPCASLTCHSRPPVEEYLNIQVSLSERPPMVLARNTTPSSVAS